MNQLANDIVNLSSTRLLELINKIQELHPARADEIYHMLWATSTDSAREEGC